MLFRELTNRDNNNREAPFNVHHCRYFLRVLAVWLKVGLLYTGSEVQHSLSLVCDCTTL